MCLISQIQLESTGNRLVSLFHLRPLRVFSLQFDNIDHHPSSTTATSALHKQSTAFFLVNTSKVKNDQNILDPVEVGQKHVKSLSVCYRTMDPDITLSNYEVFHIPPLNISHAYPLSQPVTKNIIEDVYQWLDDVKKLL